MCVCLWSNKFLEQGFCDHDINYMAPDQRGTYNWTEAEVGTILKRDCSFEPQVEYGVAEAAD